MPAHWRSCRARGFLRVGFLPGFIRSQPLDFCRELIDAILQFRELLFILGRLAPVAILPRLHDPAQQHAAIAGIGGFAVGPRRHATGPTPRASCEHLQQPSAGRLLRVPRIGRLTTLQQFAQFRPALTVTSRLRIIVR